MKIRSFVVIGALLVGASSVAGPSSPAPFEAGFATTEITPPSEMWPNVWHVSRRRPTGVLDPLTASAVFLDGDRRVGIVSMDLLGLFYDDIELIRDQVRSRLGPDVDVIVASTHSHSSIDTLGIYGPDEVTSGIYEPYQQFMRDKAADAIVQAADNARPATMRYGVKPAPDGINEFDRNRHPGSFDNNVHVIEFLSDGESLGTIVNWASHPELINPKATNDPGIDDSIEGSVISSDYVHELRETVTAETGSDVVFLNGPNGAVTGLALTPPGTSLSGRSVAKAYYVGEKVGETALAALNDGITDTAPTLGVANLVFDLTIDNPFVLALKAAGVVDRPTYAAGVQTPMGRDVRTEMVKVNLGPIEMMTVPGELQPDLYTGGYLPEDEKANPDVPEERPIAPQMSGDLNFLIGLGMDELGYFVSATDYVNPSFWPVYGQGEDRNGVEHYQETLSLGRDTARSIAQFASQLLGMTPETSYVAYPAGFLDADGQPVYGSGSTEVRGVWVDTSDSGRYERNEDAEAFLAVPTDVPAAYGFLDSQLRDIGPVPANGMRGVWVDGNGDGIFTARSDPHLFFDSYIFGEGEFGA